jgi:hypothetical protein
MSPPPPESRSPEPWLVRSEITCSTGPPGANCTMAKEIAMMPTIVGIISRRRRRI